MSQPAVVHQSDRFPLAAEAIIKRTRLPKVFTDGSSVLNLLYARTLDAMKIPRTALRPSRQPFHGEIPGDKAYPTGQIDLTVTFETPENLKSEKLTFEVVNFANDNRAILGRPCYDKSTAVPNIAYLKLKMPGLQGRHHRQLKRGSSTRE
jgi:hypothetical protein